MRVLVPTGGGAFRVASARDDPWGLVGRGDQVCGADFVGCDSASDSGS